MPRTRSLAWSELKIGIIATVALILAATIIVAVGGAGGGFFTSRYELTTKFPDVMGLKSGAVVRLAGVEVGKVTDVRFSGAEVEVVVEVDESMRPRITTESRASIGSLSLLGEPVIDITPAATGTPLNDGEHVPSEPTRGQLNDMAASATDTLDEATLLLRDLRAGKGSVGRLFTDDALYRDLQAFVSSAEDLVAGVRRGEGTIGQLLRNPAAYRKFDAALANLQETTRRINAGEGTIGRLMNDDALAKSLTSASGNLDSLTGGLARGEGTAGKLLKERELYDRINSVAARIDKVVSTLEQGQGTAGQLLHDKQLYENMNNTVKELQTLIGEIRKDPKKYLTVRVSIF
jgi:phospholipid/cholesterol/gamma-HCH transport system substrate-binding protein